MILNAKVLPSASVAASVPVADVSSVVESVPFAAIGATLRGGATVIEIVATFESKAPSLALKVKLVCPEKLAAGVNVYAPVAAFVRSTVP